VIRRLHGVLRILGRADAPRNAKEFGACSAYKLLHCGSVVFGTEANEQRAQRIGLVHTSIVHAARIASQTFAAGRAVKNPFKDRADATDLLGLKPGSQETA